MRLPLRKFSILSIACCAALGVNLAYAASDAAMGGGLRELVAAWETSDARLNSQMDLHIKSAAGEPLLHLQLQDLKKSDSALSALRALGFRVSAISVIDPTHIEGYLPLSMARSAMAIDGVKSLQAVQKPIHRAGSVQSQAVALQKADLAQAAGFNGAGTRIGVLSDSYDTCAACKTHAAGDISTGDLPADVTVLEDFPKGTDEGRAMMQLVYDIAPAAKLGFATADKGQIGFANNIVALRNQFKADVIVDDVIYFAEPMYSDGIIAQAVDIVSKSGAAYFSSAGNNGMEAYEATYRPLSFDQAKAAIAGGVGNLKLDQIPAAIKPKSLHLFGRGGDDAAPAFSQTLTSAGGNNISFQWDEPFFQGKVKTDFNIYVFDAAGNWMDPASADFPGFYTTDDNTQTDRPFEYVYLAPFTGELHGGANASDYQIVIGKVNDGTASHIKYVNINSLGVSQRQGAGSIFGHAAAKGGQAVAATYYAIPQFPEDFSAPGPVAIYFDATGRRLDEPEIRNVPQITAADGVDTTFFGFDADANGLPNFFGTSAAAPNAAAVAALVIQAAGGSGSIAPKQLYKVLQQTATPIKVAENRAHVQARVGPVDFTADGDWTRWSRYFGLAVDSRNVSAVKSVAFDVSGAGLIFSANPNRFHIGFSNGASGATMANITRTRSTNGKIYTLSFAPGTFGAGAVMRFGHSVFNPLEGSTQEDPDRFRGTVITVTLEDGTSYTSTVKTEELQSPNRFTGAGLVNADAATRRAQRHD